MRQPPRDRLHGGSPAHNTASQVERSPEVERGGLQSGVGRSRDDSEKPRQERGSSKVIQGILDLRVYYFLKNH